MPETYINLVFEDILSETVVRKLLHCAAATYGVGAVHNGGGFGWIKKKIKDFNSAAKGMPYLVLTDLDTCECAPTLIRQWLNTPKHPNLLFRVAVREVEAWLLGCREAFAAFLGVPESRIPADVEAIADPKVFVVNLARRSRKRDVRLDIVPEDGSTAKVGPAYNARLRFFVETSWDPAVAKTRSPSLRRTMNALDVFQPVLLSPYSSDSC
jgi:hypothetical protein